MSDLVPIEDIERIVGMARQPDEHFGRAVSDDQMVYILHSQECKDIQADLRDCHYSWALDEGIDPETWADYQDVPVLLDIYNGRLVPWEPK